MDFGDSIGRGLSLFGESLKEGFEFGKAKWKRIFLYMLISSIIIVIGAAAGALLAAIAAYLLPNSIGWTAAIVVAAVLFLIPFIAGLAYGFGAMFGAIEFIYLNKKVGYFEVSNVKTGFKWALLGVVVVAAIAAIFGGAVLSMATVPILGLLLFMLFYVAFIVAAVVLSLVAYYAIYEGAAKKKGPIDSIFSSYRMLKANFWETVVFLILIGVVSYIGGLAAGVAYYALYFVGMLMMLFSPIAALAMIAVAFLVLMLLEVLIQCFILPMQVLFYKKIVDGKGMVAEKKAAAKKK